MEKNRACKSKCMENFDFGGFFHRIEIFFECVNRINLLWATIHSRYHDRRSPLVLYFIQYCCQFCSQFKFYIQSVAKWLIYHLQFSMRCGAGMPRFRGKWQRNSGINSVAKNETGGKTKMNSRLLRHKLFILCSILHARSLAHVCLFQNENNVQVFFMLRLLLLVMIVDFLKREWKRTEK